MVGDREEGSVSWADETHLNPFVQVGDLTIKIVEGGEVFLHRNAQRSYVGSVFQKLFCPQKGDLAHRSLRLQEFARREASEGESRHDNGMGHTSFDISHPPYYV